MAYGPIEPHHPDPGVAPGSGIDPHIAHGVQWMRPVCEVQGIHFTGYQLWLVWNMCRMWYLLQLVQDTECTHSSLGQMPHATFYMLTCGEGSSFIWAALPWYFEQTKYDWPFFLDTSFSRSLFGSGLHFLEIGSKAIKRIFKHLIWLCMMFNVGTGARDRLILTCVSWLWVQFGSGNNLRQCLRLFFSFLKFSGHWLCCLSGCFASQKQYKAKLWSNLDL